MATTKIADIITPEVLASMASAEISNFLDFERTGLCTSDYNNVDIRQGGTFAEVPFYNQLDQTTEPSEVLEDDKSLTPSKITTGKDIGVVCHRGKAWGSRDLAKIISGSDPQKEIAKQVGKYWAKDLRTTFINVLNGLFAATTGVLGKDATNPHKLAVGVTTGTAVPFSHVNALAAMNLIGDAMNDFDVIIMHSKVYTDLVTAKLTTWSLGFNPETVKADGNDSYLGKKIIVSDNVPVDVSTPAYPIYTTYFAKKGSMYLGRQQDLMTETDRDILAFEDVISTSIHFVPHVKLCKWKVTTTNPTNAVLATSTNWEVVANDHKFIGLVALDTN